MPTNTYFDDLLALLGRLEVPISPSEAHGLLCGLLCTHPSTVAKGVWLGELLDAAALEPGSLAERATDIRSLDGWFAQVLESLNHADLTFNLMLPPDTVTPAEQARALGDYCAGFCYGIGIGTAGRGNGKLPTDTAELIKDFNEIDSTVTNDSQSADEETLIELIEYVRVGVLLVNEELQPVTAATTENQVH